MVGIAFDSSGTHSFTSSGGIVLAGGITLSGATTSVGTNSSGQALQINPAGNTIFGGGATLPTSAVTGFVLIPTISGPPASAPAAHGASTAMVFDTVSGRIRVYDPNTSSWKSTVSAVP